MATISGSHGSDKIKGTSNDDVLKGNAGNDVIKGGKGDDTIQGGSGNDKLYGENGEDILLGNSGIDHLYGGNDNDIFNNIEDDYVYGGSGNDVFNLIDSWDSLIYNQNYNDLTGDDKPGPIYKIYGESGNDVFNVPYHNNLLFSINKKKEFLLDGGGGNDIFKMPFHEGGSKIVLKSLSSKILFNGGSGIDTFEACLICSDEDTISFDNTEYELGQLFNYTKNFEKFIVNVGGNQVPSYDLKLKDKTITSNSFQIDLVTGYKYSNVYIDAIDEKKSNLKFYTHENYYQDFNKSVKINTNIVSGQSHDTFIGEGEGDDIFQGNGGNDYFFGADGNNIAVFNGNKKQYHISEIGYNKFKVRDKVKGRDGIDTIENVNTLRFANGDYDLVIKGLKIEGDGSAEVINGGNYSDYLDGGAGNDKLRGRKGNDQLIGGKGNDRLYGEAGNDQLIGGKGNDTAVFSSKSNVVKLSITKTQNTKDGLDTLIGIENVNAGSGHDKIYGSKGSNILNGGKGNDLLVGGLGNDTLIGGKGKDIFKLSKGKGYDLIQDFKNKQDKIFIGSMKKLKLENKGKDVFIYSGKDLLAKVKKAKGLLSKKGKYLV